MKKHEKRLLPVKNDYKAQMEEEIKTFWNNCDLHFSHNIIGGHLKNYDFLTKSWEESFINKIDFNNKIILDYAIGGAYLGKYLFENKNISFYYGIDISDRSLKKASQVLGSYRKFKLYNTENFYNSFNNQIDIIISQACIQHFPIKDNLDEFLTKVNNLNANVIMLQIAHNEKTIFTNKYKNIEDVHRACFTNKSFISEYLVNYKIDYESPIAKNNYQFLIFTKK